MDSLYVCHFSNGHIKVGRSSTPAARIRQHRERVSCMGITLISHHTVHCSDMGSGEAALIKRCASAATGKHKNEWFEGLVYDAVCEWADDIAAQTPAKAQQKLGLILRTDNFPPTFDRAYVCRCCSRFHDANKANSAYLCRLCAAKGYEFNQDGLHLRSEPVPMWAQTIDSTDHERFPGVSCEELRPDLPWLRVAHDGWPVGKPLLDYAEQLARPKRTPEKNPQERSTDKA